jgi:hypothetical protein
VILLTWPFDGIVAVFKEVMRQAEDALYDEANLHRELKSIYTRLEAGELSEEEFTRREGELAERLAIAEEYNREAPRGALGVEAVQIQSGGASTRSNLADILSRVLDAGVVIAGDIKIKIVDIELLSIQVRLVIASVDKAREMGLDWWTTCPELCPQARRRKRGRIAAPKEACA